MPNAQAPTCQPLCFHLTHFGRLGGAAGAGVSAGHSLKSSGGDALTAGEKSLYIR